MKKAQEISVHMIVVAAIALLVLVVLILIFTGRIGEFSKGIKECPTESSRCVDQRNECSESEAVIPRKCFKEGGGEGSYCCMPLTKQEES